MHSHTSSERSNTVVFDQMEQELIKNFLSKPEPYLSVDEVDELLETTKKSKDAQNQKRSAVTRSINNKYFMITGEEGNLISTSRMEFDRRMIQYILDLDKYSKIKHLFNQSNL